MVSREVQTVVTYSRNHKEEMQEGKGIGRGNEGNKLASTTSLSVLQLVNDSVPTGGGRREKYSGVYEITTAQQPLITGHPGTSSAEAARA